MPKMKVTKVEAARRQLDAAIRMLFANEDPLAIHTLCMAAFRILRDLAAKRPGHNLHEAIQRRIRPGMEKEFWKAVWRAANFLKHADRDADEVLEFDERVNDGIMALASPYFQFLGNQPTPEMRILEWWVCALHPSYVGDNIPSDLKPLLEELRIKIAGKPRQEQLAFAQDLLHLHISELRGHHT
jgi:hypothetical protein